MLVQETWGQVADEHDEHPNILPLNSSLFSSGLIRLGHLGYETNSRAKGGWTTNLCVTFKTQSLSGYIRIVVLGTKRPKNSKTNRQRTAHILDHFSSTAIRSICVPYDNSLQLFFSSWRTIPYDKNHMVVDLHNRKPCIQNYRKTIH